MTRNPGIQNTEYGIRSTLKVPNKFVFREGRNNLRTLDCSEYRSFHIILIVFQVLVEIQTAGLTASGIDWHLTSGYKHNILNWRILKGSDPSMADVIAWECGPSISHSLHCRLGALAISGNIFFLIPWLVFKLEDCKLEELHLAKKAQESV